MYRVHQEPVMQREPSFPEPARTPLEKQDSRTVMTPMDSSIVNWHATKHSYDNIMSSGQERLYEPMLYSADNGANSSNRIHRSEQNFHEGIAAEKNIQSFDESEEKKVVASPGTAFPKKTYSLGSLLSREYDPSHQR